MDFRCLVASTFAAILAGLVTSIANRVLDSGCTHTSLIQVMHELFTTAVVLDATVLEVLKILQGLCAMTPVHQFERRLIFEGPKSNPLIGIPTPLLPSRKRENELQWRELHKQLVRQSYYMAVSYDIKENQFGLSLADGDNAPNGPSTDEMRGTLHFQDNPDPQIESRPAVSRLIIRIKDERGLPAFLKQVNYTYSREQIRESYYAYRDNVIFCLSRDLRHPSPPGHDPETIAINLPAFESYVPFDAENKWALTASVEVLDGNQPTLVKRGIDMLMQVSQDFAGILDFEVTSRRQLDTRLLSYIQSTRG